MSKFFNETRKAQDWALREGATKRLDVQRMLENVKENAQKADAVATDLAETRVGRSGKVHLARSSDSPVIYAGSESTEEALESYRALRTRLMRLQAEQGIRSVVMSSALPGEGKTLTTLNLALCCAQLHDQRVLVIDADLRTRGLSELLGQPARPGLGEILASQAQFNEGIFTTDLPNLHGLCAGASTAPPAELFADNRWKEFIGWCSESFKLVLVDSPPILPLADFELIASPCDGVLAVVRALQTQRTLLRKASAQIDPKKLLGIVFNATESEHRNGYYNRYYTGNTKQK